MLVFGGVVTSCPARTSKPAACGIASRLSPTLRSLSSSHCIQLFQRGTCLRITVQNASCTSHLRNITDIEEGELTKKSAFSSRHVAIGHPGHHWHPRCVHWSKNISSHASCVDLYSNYGSPALAGKCFAGAGLNGSNDMWNSQQEKKIPTMRTTSSAG